MMNTPMFFLLLSHSDETVKLDQVKSTITSSYVDAKEKTECKDQTCE